VRVLLDENVPVDLAAELPGHEVLTTAGLGWAGLKNGELLARARGRCEVFLTFDSNLEHQQQLSGLTFGVVVVRPRSSRMRDVLPLVTEIRQALAAVRPGEVRHVGLSA
jgi:predicted nuclease of predicted toxin-antitoxin system